MPIGPESLNQDTSSILGNLLAGLQPPQMPQQAPSVPPESPSIVPQPYTNWLPPDASAAPPAMPPSQAMPGVPSPPPIQGQGYVAPSPPTFRDKMKHALGNFMTGMGDSMQIDAGMVPLRLQQQQHLDKQTAQLRQQQEDNWQHLYLQSEIAKNNAAAAPSAVTIYPFGTILNKLKPGLLTDDQEKQFNGMSADEASKSGLNKVFEQLVSPKETKPINLEQKDVSLGPLGNQTAATYPTDFNPQGPPGQQYSLPGSAASGGRRFVDALIGAKPANNENEPLSKEYADLLAKGSARTPVEDNRLKAVKSALTLGPTTSFNLQSGAGVNTNPSGKTGDEALAGIPPNDANIVKGLAEGRVSLPSSFALRTPYWQRIMGNLMSYDPQFSEQRAQVRKAFTTGPDGRNIGALNTATVHLDYLGDISKALSSGDIRAVNDVSNIAKTEFGYSAPTNFEGVKSAVSGEMAAALKGNATDIEIANIGKDIQAKNSPKQLSDYINTQMHILHQKLDTYQQRYSQQIPGDTTWSPVLPQAAAAFSKRGITPGGGPQGNAGGLSHSVGETVLTKAGPRKITAITNGKYVFGNP